MSSNDNGATLEATVNLEGITDVEILKAKIQEERDERIKDAEAKKQILARAKTAEEKLKEQTPDPKLIKPKEDTQINPMDIIRGEAFKLYREGYNEDEIDLILKNGGREVLKDEKNPIAIGLRIAREQRAAEVAASQTQGASGQAEVLRQYTPEQLKNMKSKDLEKILPHA